MTPMKNHAPTKADESLRMKVLDLVRKEMSDMPAERILAIMAYTVGQLVAMQDQRKFTPAMAMQLVASNIEAGNADVIAKLSSTSEGNPQ